MLKQKGTSNTHIVYFQRNFLQLDEYDSRLRKLKVTFGGLRQSNQNEPEKFVIWQKSSGFQYNVVFKPEEFCAMDTIEQEIPRPGSLYNCICGKYTTYKQFHCLYILLLRDNHQTIIQLLEPKNAHQSKELQGSPMPEPAVFSLQKSIKDHIGSFDQWTVKVQSCQGLEVNEDVLLSNTKHAFSILRGDFVMMSSHSFQNNNFICMFNPVTETLRIEVSQKMHHTEITQNFQFNNTYEFRTDSGSEIESKINENWRLKNNLPRTSFIGVEQLLNKTPHFPDHIDSTISSNGHATMIVEEAEINGPRPGRLHIPQPVLQLADSEQQPPAPCPGAEPSPTIAGLIPETGLIIPRAARPFLRSISFPSLLTDEKFKDHVYANESIESWEEHCKNGKEEDIYYRFYYNLGYVRSNEKASMRTKLKRRSILSEVMGKVDFEALDEHESWFDDCVGKPTKGKGNKLSRADKVKTKVDSDWSDKKHNHRDRSFYSTSDDSNQFDDKSDYWNSDLCLTLQTVLEGKKSDLCNKFDITFNQLKGVVFHMSLTISGRSRKDWKDMAALLEMSSLDVSIIESFCHHCPSGACASAMGMEVLLRHWSFHDKFGRTTIACNRNNLEELIIKLNRRDVLNILHNENTNNHIQSEKDFESTHF